MRTARFWIIYAAAIAVVLLAGSFPVHAGGPVDNRTKPAQTGTNVAGMGSCTADCNGNMVCPDVLDHAYAYNGSNQLTTDTATDTGAAHTWVKTYSYSGTSLTNETCWAPR